MGLESNIDQLRQTIAELESNASRLQDECEAANIVIREKEFTLKVRTFRHLLQATVRTTDYCVVD